MTFGRVDPDLLSLDVGADRPSTKVAPTTTITSATMPTTIRLRYVMRVCWCLAFNLPPSCVHLGIGHVQSGPGFEVFAISNCVLIA